jgi:hypothetical protein
MDTQDILFMSSALCSLISLSPDMQTTEYKAIVESVKKYLHENCKHCFVEDDIDIGPESSKKIFYCNLCYLEK